MIHNEIEINKEAKANIVFDLSLKSTNKLNGLIIDNQDFLS